MDGCVFWCDWEKALEVGMETFCNSIRDVTMRNCHIIRSCFASINVYCCHQALIENLLFEDITVQNDDYNPRFVFQQTEEEHFVDDLADDFVPNLAVCQVAYWDYDHSGKRGNVRNVVFRNISCLSRLRPAIVIGGYDSAHTVEGVRFENIIFNGKKAETLEQLKLQNLGFTKDVILS